jgi:hypothetical protein
VLADGHLWYDKRQGFIASFLPSNLERIRGIGIGPDVRVGGLFSGRAAADSGTLEALQDSSLTEVFEAIMTGTMAVVGKVERGPMRHALNWRDRSTLHRTAG